MKGQSAPEKDLEKGRAMDDQVIQKVKSCAVDYLHMRMDDSISVSEIFRDDTTQGFDVSIQGREVPTPQRCIVVVKDGQASVLDESDAPPAFQP
jgi:hypothetical protein